MEPHLTLKGDDVLNLARFGIAQAIRIASEDVSMGEVRLTAAAPMAFDLPELARFRIPEVGQYWEGEGGIRAVPDLKDEDGRIYDLIVITGPDKKTPVFFKDRQWGHYGTEIPDASSKRNGIANIKALVADGNVLAKEIAETKSAEGHTDCYWPDQAALMGCYVFVPELFGTDVYWSSSQDDAHYAWGQSFEYGYVGYWNKSSTGKAFPVRRRYR